MLINNEILEFYQEAEKSEAEINDLYEQFITSLADPDDEEPAELFSKKFVQALIESIKKNLELNIYDKNVAGIINLFREGEFSAALTEISRIRDDPRYIKFKKPFERLMSTVPLLLKKFRDAGEIDAFIREREKEEKFKREYKPFYGSGI